MIDGCLNGDKLPPNIFWVAAVNPYRRDNRDIQSRLGGRVSFRDAYYVRLLPSSMNELGILLVLFIANEIQKYGTLEIWRVIKNTIILMQG